MAQLIRRFWKDRRGATAIEYGLIATLIAMVVIGAMSNLGDVISNKLYNNIVEGLKN